MLLSIDFSNTHKLRGISVLLLLLGLQIYASGQGSSLFSLKQSVQYALQNSPTLQKAKLETRKSEEVIREYKSTGLPQVNASSGFTYNAILPTNLLPNFFQGKPDELVAVRFGTNINTSYGADFSQLLYSQSYWTGLKAIKELRGLNNTLEQKSEEDIAYNVIRTYLQVQTIAKQRNLIEANLKQVEGLLKTTELQFKNGLAKKLDVDQLRVNKISLETQLQNLSLNVEQGLQVLKMTMSMPQETQLVLTDTLNEAVMPVAADPSSFIPSYQNKVELKILDQQARLQQLNVDQFRAGYWPQLRAFGNWNRQGQGNALNTMNWFSASAFGLNLSVPIFDGFFRKSKIEQANIDMLKVIEDRKLANQSLQLQHSQAKQQLISTWNTLNSIRENRKVAEEVYLITQKRYKEGLASITEVFVAERTMREIQSTFLSTLLQFQLAQVDLDFANAKILTLYK